MGKFNVIRKFQPFLICSQNKIPEQKLPNNKVENNDYGGLS